MARVQLYSKNDKRLNKQAVNTWYKRKLLIFQVLFGVSLGLNCLFSYLKFLK